MDTRDTREVMAERLSEVDWGTGVDKAHLLDHVASDASLRNLIDQYAPDGTYLNAAAVLDVIPEQAWQGAQGDILPTGTVAAMAPGMDQSFEGHAGQKESAGDQGTEGATSGEPGRLRQVAHQVTGVAQGIGQSASALPHQARQVVGDVAAKVPLDDVRSQAAEGIGRARDVVVPLAQGAGEVADRAKQAGSQGLDQVVSITTKVGQRVRPTGGELGTEHPPAADTRKFRRTAVPVALSSLMEGLGQAYNRQPIKASGFLVAGLSLSTLSGLNTWLAQRVFRAKGTRLGPERIRPLLLGLWIVTFVINLWDAWKTARSRQSVTEPAQTSSEGTAMLSPQTWDDVALTGPTTSAAATQATDEFPTLSPTAPAER
ncbi:MAG: hypothetical protein M3Q03_21165 [Chloroflexota bacterium]|nr:hypothetical protein [Chloroflexota bacterium]